MAQDARIDLTEKMGWFGPIRFVSAEWTEGGRLVLLSYEYDDGSRPELGIRLDLDRKSFIDDLEDEHTYSALCEHLPEIWAIVSDEYRAHQAHGEVGSTGGLSQQSPT